MLLHTPEQQYILDRVDICPDSGCWLWNKYVDHRGYGQTGRGKLWKKYGTEQVHKLSYMLFNSNIPDELVVRHKCLNKHCCNPEHLELGTDVDNSHDKYRDGTDNASLGYGFGFNVDAKGSKNKHAKLTDEQVLEIRKLHATGNYILRQLGEMYGVSLSMIGYIVNRKKWTHI